MKILFRFEYCIVLLSAVVLFGCCNGRTEAWEKMDVADSLLNLKPDSSLGILQTIDSSGLGGTEERARYALLMSIALDKNYIDRTDFRVLQPAIDYYPEHGTPREKMLTYYYQGRIYDNKCDGKKAMMLYMNAAELIPEVSDSLLIARLLVAQGVLYYQSEKIEAFIQNNLRAARLYKTVGHTEYELSSLGKALDGSVLVHNKARADSLAVECRRILNKHHEYDEEIVPILTAYTAVYGSADEVREILRKYDGRTDVSHALKLDLAYCNKVIGNAKQALAWLEDAGPGDSPMKYLAIKIDVLDSLGDYKGALDAFRKFSTERETKIYKLLRDDMQFAMERHKQEIESLEHIARKDAVIMYCILGMLLLIIVVLFVCYRYKLKKSKLIIAQKERIAAQKEMERVELEANNKRMELERKNLEEENLQHRIALLENETAELKALLKDNEPLSAPVSGAIKERIEMLNALLAREIADNDTYAKPYGEWIKSVMQDKDRFMNSTRLAFKASHPRFIAYLESHGLTEYEVNYLCLYAIGLRGKEVGEYMQLRRHYNISSEIRKKLGIDEHETNIGIYVRKLMKSL